MQKRLIENDDAHWRGFVMGFWWGLVGGSIATVLVMAFVLLILGPVFEIIWRFVL